MCQNHLADIGLAPPILHHFATFGSISHWGSNQYPLTCIITLYTTPQNRYKSRREEIIKEVIKRIVASFVGVSDFFMNVWLNPEFSKKLIRACMMGKKIFLKIYISCSLVPLSLSGIKKGLIPPKNMIVLNYFPTKPYLKI